MNIKKILDNSIRELNEANLITGASPEELAAANQIQQAHDDALINRAANGISSAYDTVKNGIGNAYDSASNFVSPYVSKLSDTVSPYIDKANTAVFGPSDEELQQAEAIKQMNDASLLNAWNNGALGMSPTMTQAGMIGIPAALLAGAGALALRRRQKKAQH